MEHLNSDAAAARILKTLARLRASLPEPRKMTMLDPHIGILLIALHILALVSPPTRRWRLFRAALAPLIAMTWLWLGYVPVLRTPQERWGSNLLFCYFAFRAFEHLVVFTPEFEVYRLRPRAARLTKHHDAKGRQLIHSSTSTASHGHGHEAATLEREAIPEPWTLAKLEWAASLWWSWRGIGWNYSPPLTDSQMGEPYMRTTSRRKHLIHRAIHLAAVYALDDAAASFMRVGMPQFFVTHELKYADLTTWQRAAISIATVTRILGSLEYSHIQVGIMAVAVGGILGLEGELWEPWGWPAMFGSLGCIWRNPGLNYVWAKAWNQYYRRMYHIWAWVGLGEGVLGLPPSGKQLHRPVGSKSTSPSSFSSSTATQSGKANGVRPMPALVARRGCVSSGSVPTPPPSGHSTPTVELELKSVSAPSAQLVPPTPPATPPPAPLRRAGMWANLLKSFLVFTFSGLFHDYSSLLCLLDSIGRGKPLDPRYLISLTPFFMIQPVAIAAEAILLPKYRAFKRSKGIKRHGEGPLLTLLERAIGFAYVWVWLGWTAGWFVEGMARIGVWPVYGPWPAPFHISLFAPLWKAVM